MNDQEPAKAEIVERYTLNPGTSEQHAGGYRAEYQINGQTIRMPEVRPVESRAIIAMTLATLSWVIIPFIGSLIAIRYGVTAKQHIRWSNGRYAGSTLANVAIGVAVANIVAVVTVVALLVWIIGAIF